MSKEYYKKKITIFVLPLQGKKSRKSEIMSIMLV